jgi:hypothetical protein
MPLGFKVQWQYWVHDRILIWLKLMYVFPCLLRFIRNVTLSTLRRKLTSLHISTKMNWHWQQKLLVGPCFQSPCNWWRKLRNSSLFSHIRTYIDCWFVAWASDNLLLVLLVLPPPPFSFSHTHWGTCWENWVEDEQWGMVKAPAAISSTYCWLCALGLSSGWVLQDEVFIDTIATLGWGQRITRRMLQHGPHDMDVIVLARADIIIQLPHTSPYASPTHKEPWAS